MFGTATTQGIPTSTNVDHLGVTVPDLQQAVMFFTEVLGAEALFTFEEGPGTQNPANLNAAFGVPSDSKLKIAMLRLGLTLNLELMQYDTSDQRQVTPRNSDFDAPHIAFFVSDMEQAADYLTEHGCKLFSGPLVSKRGPKAGQSIRYFQTPWGMFLEILSRPKHMPYESETDSRLSGPVTLNSGQTRSKQETGLDRKRGQQMLTMSRTLIALPFLINGLGLLPQDSTAEALKQAGFSAESTPFLIGTGRGVQLAGGLAVVSGKFPRTASCALMTFLIGATIIGHPFWKAADLKARTLQKASMFVNLGLLGGLLHLAFTGSERNVDQSKQGRLEEGS